MLSRFFKFKIVRNTDYDNMKRFLVDKADVIATNALLEKELHRVQSELLEVKKKLSVEQKKQVLIDMDLGDPAPTDKETRALYVAQVAGLHKEIIEPKLKHMISKMHGLLEDATNDRDFDNALKGAVYFAREFMRWGDMMVNEQIANQANQNNASPEDTKYDF